VLVSSVVMQHKRRIQARFKLENKIVDAD